MCIEKADSGAFNHFWHEEDHTAFSNTHNEDGLLVKLPNTMTISDSKVGYLPFSEYIYKKKKKKVRILTH